jgi:hypothetical protein
MPALDAIFCSAAFSSLVPFLRTSVVAHGTSSLLLGLLMIVISPYIFHQLGLLPGGALPLLWLRSLILVWTLQYVFGKLSVLWGHPSIAIAMLYCLTWMPSALASSIAGDFITIKWWLFQPLTPIPRLVAWILRKRQWNWVKILKSAMVGGGVVLGLGLIAITIAFALLRLEKYFPRLPRLVSIILIVFISSGVAVYVWEFCRDAIGWYHWTHKGHATPTALDLLNRLGQYSTAFFRCKTLKEIRQADLLNSELENALRGLAIVLDESYPHSKDMELTFEGIIQSNLLKRVLEMRRPVAPVIVGNPSFGDWLLRQNNRSFLDWGPRCKDELYRLIEYIALQRTRPNTESVQ